MFVQTDGGEMEWCDDGGTSGVFNRAVGNRLRAARNRCRLSLQQVHAETHGEFKASILGAYERGERSISLPRLRRLAELYDTTLAELIPAADAASRRPADSSTGKLAIDIGTLMDLTGSPFDALSDYVQMIQIRRQDFSGKVVTVRGSDHRAIAAILGVEPDELLERLTALDLAFTGR